MMLLRSQHVLRLFLITGTVLLSWLAMQAVHEFGHVLHAWLSDGHVTRVVLHPLAISRTDVLPNPQPAFVTWGGPIWGCLIPLGLAAVARLTGWQSRYLLTFFAGFCLIANGAYLGVGCFAPVGDAQDLLNHGTAVWLLALFGVPACSLGLWLWNGLGGDFGLGPNSASIRRFDVCLVWGATLLVVVLEVMLSTMR